MLDGHIVFNFSKSTRTRELQTKDRCIDVIVQVAVLNLAVVGWVNISRCVTTNFWLREPENIS